MKDKNKILNEYSQECDVLRIKFIDNKISYDEYNKEMDNLFIKYSNILKPLEDNKK